MSEKTNETPDQAGIAKIKEIVVELAKGVAREEFEASIQVPEAIEKAGHEVEGLVTLFSPDRQNKKSAARLQTAQEMINLLKEDTEKDSKILVDTLGKVYASGHIKETEMVPNESKLEAAEKVAKLAERAVDRFPDGNPLYPKPFLPASEKERKARLYAFHGILNRWWVTEMMAVAHERYPEEFGIRLTPAIVRAYGKAAEIASRYPQPEIIKNIVGL